MYFLKKLTCKNVFNNNNNNGIVELALFTFFKLSLLQKGAPLLNFKQHAVLLAMLAIHHGKGARFLGFSFSHKPLKTLGIAENRFP